MTVPAWDRLPVGLRERPQWLLAGPDAEGAFKVPTTLRHGRPILGSSTDSTTWLAFDIAKEAAQRIGYGLGYCLDASDPYTCIDFDLYTAQNKPNDPDKWSTPEDFELCKRIADKLQSYTEFSQSGIGAHTWVKGKIGKGRQRDPVAIYSQERFIACTGNVILDLPIEDRQSYLNNMVLQMCSIDAAELVESTQAATDDEIMHKAWHADNAEKFRKLWRGDWHDMGYPSQSEADLSLMSMLTFYSTSNEQCRRLFRHSELGAREKALKNDKYLNNTLRLIRTRQKNEDDAIARLQGQSAALVKRLQAPEEAVPSAVTPHLRQLAAQHIATLQGTPPPVLPVIVEPPVPVPPPVPEGGLPWPPGAVGEVAKFIFHSAPRPVREVAIVAALGWFAGVCGKAWTIPGSGLNLYIILVARSGVGKEAMHSGLAALTHRLREGAPHAENFINFNDYASGPALAKACAAQSSFLNVSGEWGRKLQRLAARQVEGPMQSLRTVMTNLYQKSGPASIVGGVQYSNKDNNVASISGVAFSMIGETTPDTLYSCLSESMMEDGFLSRFNIVEYEGERPAANVYQNLIPDNALSNYLQGMCFHATSNIGEMKTTPVMRDAASAELMNAFDSECDAQINSSKDEAYRQMWNRAHLKMARVAALLAVADNHTLPSICVHHVQWALDLIRRDIALMQRKMAAGEVGQGDGSREKKLLHVMHEYLTMPVPTSYGVPANMPRDGIVPRKYLQMRVYSVASFVQHPYGAKRALDDSISSLIDSGYMVEVDKIKIGEVYTFQGRCFRIVNLPKFD